MEVLNQVRVLLRSKGRITYRLLKAQFQLSDDALDALKDELIEGEPVAVDADGKVLVWTGGATVPSSKFHPGPRPQTPQTPAQNDHSAVYRFQKVDRVD
jgi:hypothetical protein